VGEQAASSFFKRPTAGEKENAETDEAERSAHFVIEIAEVEPSHRNCESNDAEVDESATDFAHSPPDEEDCEGGDERVSKEIGIRTRVGAVAGAVVVVLSPSAGTPRESNA